MHFHPFSSTSLVTILCWIGASAKVSEGLVTTKNSQTEGLFPTLALRLPSASASISSTTTTSSLSVNRIPATPATRQRLRSLDLVVGKLSPGGASTSSSSSSSSLKPTPTSPPASSSSTSLFSSASGEATGCPFTKFMATFGSVWGSFGVVYILSKGITRVLPTALDPFYEASSLVLSPLQWSLYALSCLFFAYAEGYKGFHTRFAPLVVKRSFTLVIGTAQGNNPLNYLLAPLYSMGLWGATRKRQKISWSLNLGIVGIVALVKRLPPAPRCIIDAGVVVGLTIGSASILYHFVTSILTGRLPSVDACIPVREKAN